MPPTGCSPPPDSLGVLGRALDRVCALGHRSVGAGTLVLVGADHPVTRYGVSAYPASVTAEVLTAAVAGEALGAAAARAAGLRTLAVDAGVGDRLVEGAVDARRQDPAGDLVTADALSADDVERLLVHGRQLGQAAATAGVVALGEVGVGNTTIAAALTAALLDLPPSDTVGLGAGADSAMVTRKTDTITRALARARRVHSGGLLDPLVALQAVGGAEIAVLTGVVLGAADTSSPIVLDGLATCVAALAATRLEPAVAAHLIAGQRSREPAHHITASELGLEPLLDLRIRAGEGVGACLAVALLRTALDARASTATTT